MSEQQVIWLIRSGGVLILAIAALVARRPSMSLVVRSALIWAAIIGVVLLGFLLIGRL